MTDNTEGIQITKDHNTKYPRHSGGVMEIGPDFSYDAFSNKITFLGCNYMTKEDWLKQYVGESYESETE